MDISDLAKADHLHHAYIAVGDSAAEEVVKMLGNRGVVTKANADFLTFNFAELAVDDARAIAGYALLKSIGESKYFVVTFDRINDAAQNALLKVVEEAPGNTIFFFCVISAGYLLPTLKSRCILVGDVSENTDDSEAAEEFLKSSYADRLSKVDKLVAASQKSQDRTPIRMLVRSMISVVHGTKATAQVLRTLTDAERYLQLSGSSPKVVLSHLAVTLPVL